PDLPAGSLLPFTSNLGNDRNAAPLARYPAELGLAARVLEADLSSGGTDSRRPVGVSVFVWTVHRFLGGVRRGPAVGESLSGGRRNDQPGPVANDSRQRSHRDRLHADLCAPP